MSNFDWGVVAKGPISTTTNSQPIAERTVALCSRGFLYLTKQRGGLYANILKKKGLHEHGTQENLGTCKHSYTHADYFTPPQKEIRASLAGDGDLFTVASNFLLFYFKMVNLWTRLAVAVFEKKKKKGKWQTIFFSAHFRARGWSWCHKHKGGCNVTGVE